jgi:hypothetical protein
MERFAMSCMYNGSSEFDVMNTIDPDFAKSFARVDTEPFFVHAECWSGCSDHECPYTHHEGWMIKGVQGVFSSEMDAIEAQLLT